MVGSAKCSGLYFAELTTPSAPLRWLRDFLLLAQPPLLFKEGKRADYHLSADHVLRLVDFTDESHPILLKTPEELVSA